MPVILFSVPVSDNAHLDCHNAQATHCLSCFLPSLMYVELLKAISIKSINEEGRKGKGILFLALS